MRFRTIKNSLLGGQVSRTAVGRTDLPQYPHSCEILQNVIPLLSGGGYRRPGTLAQHSYQAYDLASHNSADFAPRLIPFIVSQNEAYCLALRVSGVAQTGFVTAYRATGNGTGQVQIEDATGNHPFKPWGGLGKNFLGNFDDDVWAVQYAQSNDVMWLTHPSHTPQVVKRTALDTFTVGNFDAGLSGLALAQSRPYLNQNATTATMAVGATTGSGVTLTCSVAYFNNLMIGSIFAIQSGTLTGSGGAIGFAKVTACAGTVGSPSTTCTVTILVAFADTSAHKTWWESAWSDYRGWPRTTCIFQQRLAMGGTVPNAGETLDPLGIPAGQPDSIWFAETGNYFKFTALGDSAVAGVTGVLANGQNYTTPGNFVYYPVDDSQGDGQSTGPIGIQPFRVTLADSQLDAVQWMSPSQQILLGTLAQEWIIAPVNGSFDVANSQATIQSQYGSDYVPAVRIGYELIFAMRSQAEVRAYQYNYFDQSFFGEPVQLMFDEYPKAETNTVLLGRRKYRQMAWDVSRNTLWCTDTAGNFFGMTRDRKLQVTAWHTHQMGGYDPGKGVGTPGAPGSSIALDPSWGFCDGSVASIAVVPNAVSSGMNDLWMVVKRTISGAVQWQVERMIGSNTLRDSAYSAVAPTDGPEPYYVDGAVALTDNGDGTLDYSVGAGLNGYTLSGTYYSLMWGMFTIGTNGAVSGGTATLQSPLPPDYGTLTPFHAFTLGLPYTSIIKPVRVDTQGQIGTTQGAIKRISKAYLRLYKTLMLKCGSPPGQYPTSSVATLSWAPGATMAMSPEIFTGDKQVFVPATFDRDGYLYIVQDQPLPFTLVSAVIEGETYEQ